MGTSSIGIVNKALVNSYDAKNRLSKVAIANANTAQATAATSANTVSYRINALGQRVQKIGAGTFAQPTAIPFVITLSNPPTQAQLQTLNSSTTALYANSRFVYDEQGRPLGEYSKDGKLIQEIVWFDDLPVAILKPKGANATNPMSGTGNVAGNNQDANNTGANGNTAAPANPTSIVNVEVFYVHPDHLGTPRAVTASSALNATTGTGITSPQTVNKAVWRWDSDPFGSNATANSAPNENPNTLSQTVGTTTLPYLFGFDLAFPGQKRDRETGKHYNYFRDYDPSIGRYIESDPIGLWGGINTFGYVGQQPIKLTDPFGQATSGQWKQCSGGCRIRIEDNHAGGGRHLHWECPGGRSGTCGEFGSISHGSDCSGAPNRVKDCARNNGFEPEKQPDTQRNVCGENCQKTLKAVRDAATGLIIFVFVCFAATT